MTARKILLLTLFVSFAWVPVSQAQDLLPRDNGIFKYHKAPRWRETEEHPLRVLAYVVHPVGWVVREALFRPFSALAGSTKFTRSFFGFREPFDYREPACFTSHDGIPDCNTLPPMASIRPEEPAEVSTQEKQIVFPDVNFEFDKSNLNQLGKARVRQVAQILGSVPSLKVVVEGHTDYKGTDEYNMKLGTRRAQTVVKELTDLGVDPARMSPISYGESKPLFTEEEDWARAANRRVQFTVAGSEAVQAANTELPPAKK